MDLLDNIRILASRVENALSIVQTEEATKNAFVMPMIQALGYNVFDPLEVTPELVADVGTKKGEKVDYAILRDGKPIVLFECKKAGAELNINHAAQLFRYFHVTEARFGVLTNGVEYQFFTDLEQPNKMDEIPFFVFNIRDFDEGDVKELKKFAKTAYDLDLILNTANELKYTRAICARLNEWMLSPPEDFVRLLCADLLPSKRFTAAIKDQFTELTSIAFSQMIGEKINDRLKGAMSSSAIFSSPPLQQTEEVETVSKLDEVPQVTTTENEWAGYYTVKAIVSSIIPAKRVTIRDAQSYCAVLLDDNNRQPVCRLRFNNDKKLKIGLFDKEKNEEIIGIESVDDIHRYAQRILDTVHGYMDGKKQPQQQPQQEA